jgi:hypothetical protein
MNLWLTGFFNKINNLGQTKKEGAAILSDDRPGSDLNRTDSDDA